MGKISVVINTYLEESNIAGAVKSAKQLGDEVIVVDTYSSDKTVEIAKQEGATIYLHEYLGYVEPVRNFAISKAKGDWVFILDADERIPASLAEKLKATTKADKVNYLTVPRKNIVFGKWLKHSRWWPDYNVRFFKKGKVTWSNKIHSVPETVGPGADLPAEEKYAISHTNYTSISQYIERLNRYTTVQSKDLVSKDHKFSWRNLIRKPVEEFFSRFFQGEGYKDGLHGLVVAGLQAFSEFVLYLKVWELEGHSKLKISPESIFAEVARSRSDYLYWKADTLVKTGGGLVNRIKRKLRLP